MGTNDIGTNGLIVWCDLTKLGTLSVPDLNRALDIMKTDSEEKSAAIKYEFKIVGVSQTGVRRNTHFKNETPE
jgi:hypothetical protein